MPPKAKKNSGPKPDKPSRVQYSRFSYDRPQPISTPLDEKQALTDYVHLAATGNPVRRNVGIAHADEPKKLKKPAPTPKLDKLYNEKQNMKLYNSNLYYQAEKKGKEAGTHGATRQDVLDLIERDKQFKHTRKKAKELKKALKDPGNYDVHFGLSSKALQGPKTFFSEKHPKKDEDEGSSD